jgi:hypothetical protein
MGQSLKKLCEISGPSLLSNLSIRSLGQGYGGYEDQVFQYFITQINLSSALQAADQTDNKESYK